MNNVTNHTRAGKNGKEIFCPKCGGNHIVYHFAWCAITCQTCEAMVDKLDWYLDGWKIEVDQKLKTTDDDLHFTLRFNPSENDEPLIVVGRGDFQWPAYCLSSLDDDDFDGWCVMSHRYDGYVAVSAEAHKALVTEAHAVILKYLGEQT